MPQPGSAFLPVAAVEGEAQERVGAALGQLLHDLLQQRPSQRSAPHHHLPAALYAQARIEQKLGVAFKTTISHGHSFPLRPGCHDHKFAQSGRWSEVIPTRSRRAANLDSRPAVVSDGVRLTAVSGEMTYSHLGRSGLRVSSIGLGTMRFGFTADEKASVAIMDAAIEAGINFFDTADVYGGPQSPDMAKGYGISEEIIGRWLKRTAAATRSSWRRRCTSRWDRGRTTGGCRPSTSAARARRACDGCRPITSTSTRCTTWTDRRRGGDLAGDGATRPRRQDQLRRQQQLRCLGRGARPVRRRRTATSSGLVSEQSLYNLAVRTVELELIPALRSLGIGLIPYSPLHAGLLAGALQAEVEGRSPDEMQPPVDGHRDQLEAYEGLCRELSATPAHVALAWLLQNPVVSAAIVGPTTTEDLVSSLGALSVQLDADVVAGSTDLAGAGRSAAGVRLVRMTRLGQPSQPSNRDRRAGM